MMYHIFPKNDSERESNQSIEDGLDNGPSKTPQMLQSSAHVKFKIPINAPPTKRCKVLKNEPTSKQTNNTKR